MHLKECCKTCKHCISTNNASYSWCQMRKIKVHAEISQTIFCHHWTSAVPKLPNIKQSSLYMDKQLDLGKRVLSAELN